MPDWQEADDRRLVSRAQDGDVEAYGELYLRHAGKVFGYLAAHVDSIQDAEDLTGDVFYRCWQALPGYHERGVPFLAYLLRIARNALVDHYRREKRYNHEEIEKAESLPTNPQTQPVEIVVARMELQHLRHLLDQLRPDYRTVLVLRFMSELTVLETARVMDRSTGAVRVLQHRALEALRDLLPEDQDEHQNSDRQE
jgi:RNA polymerase sigma-70 factor, ECF subfamily